MAVLPEGPSPGPAFEHVLFEAFRSVGWQLLGPPVAALEASGPSPSLPPRTFPHLSCGRSNTSLRNMPRTYRSASWTARSRVHCFSTARVSGSLSSSLIPKSTNCGDTGKRR